jgi:spoIIIJ-associated protein
MPWITKEGRTVEEAQEAAISEAGVPESDLDIEVVNEGAKGLFGLGGEPAVVRVRRKSEATDVRDAFRDDITPARDDTEVAHVDVVHDELDEEPQQPWRAADEEFEGEGEGEGDDKRPLSERQQEAADLGVEIVRGILERMELEGDINTRIAGGTVYIEVFGEEMGILIGRSGTTLEALQELVRAGIQRRLKTRQAVVVDVESYWERRRKPQRGREGNARREGGGRRGGGQRRGRRNGGGGNRREAGGESGNRREPGGTAGEESGNR